jgi:hypothetical protein
MQPFFSIQLPNNLQLIFNRQSHIARIATPEETTIAEQDCRNILSIFLDKLSVFTLNDILIFEREVLHWRIIMLDNRKAPKREPIYTNLSPAFIQWFLGVEQRVQNRFQYFSN